MKKALTVLLLLVSAHLFSQTPKAPTKAGRRGKIIRIVYLEKKDSTFITIKKQAITDLKSAAKKSDPNTPENKAKAAEMQTWSEEKRNAYYVSFEKSLRDYIEQVHFDFDTFMLIFRDLGEYDQHTLEKYDFRVRDLGANKYAGEFWEDGLIANSEAEAIIWAKKLMKRDPDDKTIMATVKETYARARKLITDGKQPRYTKIMALLYTKEKNGPVIFHDPGDALPPVK